MKMILKLFNARIVTWCCFKHINLKCTCSIAKDDELKYTFHCLCSPQFHFFLFSVKLSPLKIGTTRRLCEIVVLYNRNWNITTHTVSEPTCSKCRLFQVWTEQGIFSGVVSSSKPVILCEWGNSDRQSEPTTKGECKNNWKWIPTNANSLLLNCFGLA